VNKTEVYRATPPCTDSNLGNKCASSYLQEILTHWKGADPSRILQRDRIQIAGMFVTVSSNSSYQITGGTESNCQPEQRSHPGQLLFQHRAGRTQNVLNIQPVIPLKVSKDWNLFVRWITPIIYQPIPGAQETGSVLQTLANCRNAISDHPLQLP
jgi:hypothetical protein